MSLLARWCDRHRKTVVASWVALFLALLGGVIAAGTAFSTVADLPDSESATAYELLADAGMDGASEDGPTERGIVVWHTDGSLNDQGVTGQVDTLLGELAEVPGVVAVTAPTDPAGVGQSNEIVGTAYAALTVRPDINVDAVREVTDAFDGSVLQVAAGGQAFTELPAPAHGQEVVGIIAAFAILLLAFRSVWASVLPILTGVVGVGASLLTVVLGSHLVEVSDTALTMGALIGLGVGIDYALFIVNRYRKALIGGAGVSNAIVQAVDTSGRAVVFAGLTVMVAFTVAAAITLLPALLGMLGTRVLSKRQRSVLAGNDHATARPMLAGRWASATGRAPWLAGFSLFA